MYDLWDSILNFVSPSPHTMHSTEVTAVGFFWLVRAGIHDSANLFVCLVGFDLLRLASLINTPGYSSARGCAWPGSTACCKDNQQRAITVMLLAAVSSRYTNESPAERVNETMNKGERGGEAVDRHRINISPLQVKGARRLQSSSPLQTC